MSIYFAYAIYKIREMVIDFNEKSNIDTKIFIVHITSLILNIAAEGTQMAFF
jgi:hypothetical protein